MARPVRGRLEVMTAHLPGRAKAVAIFSFEEEARMFLWLSRARAGVTAEGGWAVRRTHPGALASVLLDPCRRGGRVALDPMPGPAAGPVNALASMGRRDFLLSDRVAYRRAQKRATVS